MRKRKPAYQRATLICVCGLPLLGLLWFLPQRDSRGQGTGAAGGGPNGPELVQNGSFEEVDGALPRGWNWDRKQTGDKGRASADTSQAHGGGTSLRLEPNRKNGGSQPLAVAQLIPAQNYRGRKVWVSAYLKADGGAGAVLAVLSLVRGKPSNLVGDGQSSGDWALHQKEYMIPDDASVQLLVICSTNGTSGAAWFDEVSVRPDEPAAGAGGGPVAARRSGGDGDLRKSDAVDTEGQVLKAVISVDADKVIRQIPDTLFGANMEWIWNGNMLWNEQQRKPDQRILQLTRDLGITLLRYPGGYYSDYYQWRNAVGNPQDRKEMVHDGSGRERSKPMFGTDEALEFAKLVGAELLITVNAGTGTAHEAAEWVRYVNGRGTRVRFWEVGNELYINDGSPISKKVTVDPATYARRFREFATAMKAVDRNIRVGAIGGENRGAYSFVQYRDWNKTLLQQAGDQIDFLAVHNAYAPVSIKDSDDIRSVYRAMLAAPMIVGQNLATVARQLSQYGPSGRRIPIAVTEWGPLFQVDPRGAYADHTKTLGSALYAASVLKVMLESPDTQIANFHTLNDLGIMGWIGSTNPGFPPRPEWNPTARYYAFELLSRHFGRQLTSTQTISPKYDSSGIGAVDSVRDVPYLDVASSLSADGKQLYVLAINRNFDSPVEASIDIRGFRPGKDAKAWSLTGKSIDANTGTKPIQAPGMAWGRQKEDAKNPRFGRGGPDEVVFGSSPVPSPGQQFRYAFPPHSITSLVLNRS